MLLISSPIPSICVSPASPEKTYPQPYSPFPSTTLDIEVDDGYRANRLTVPCSRNTSPWHPSPLRPANCPPRKGLSREQFDSLLKVSREQRATLKTQKAPDLRKELALKNQRLKQVERRAVFLSKVNELPTTVTDFTPKSHLDSPLIVHPVNGLGSPFHALGSATEFDWPIDLGSDNGVEHIAGITAHLSTVAMAGSKLPPTMAKKRRGAPSLDEITAHMKATRTAKRDTSQSKLPSFLKASDSSLGPVRIKPFSIRTLALNDEKFDLSAIQGNVLELSYPSKVDLTTPVAPSVINITPGSLNHPTQRAGRAIAAQGMIATLQRRNSPPPGLRNAPRGQASPELTSHSVPVRLQQRGRIGFNRATL